MAGLHLDAIRELVFIIVGVREVVALQRLVIEGEDVLDVDVLDVLGAELVVELVLLHSFDVFEDLGQDGHVLKLQHFELKDVFDLVKVGDLLGLRCV